MKKFALVLIVAITSILPAALAQQSSSVSGTFSGSVAGKCLAKTLTQTGSMSEENTGDADFSGQLKGSGVFNFRSNVICTQSITPSTVTGPDAAVGACSFANPNDFTAAQSSVGGKDTGVNATITATGDNVLLAGTYNLTCTATVTSTL